MERGNYVDILRLSKAEQEALVVALNRRPNHDEERKQRTSDRYPYRLPEGLQVEFRQPEEPPRTFLVAPRNISVGGISFLHGSFVYGGTECVVNLQKRNGLSMQMRGRVARCRCIHGRVHEIGIAFAAPIEIDEYVDIGRPSEAPEDTPYSAVNVVGLARRLQDQAFRGQPLEELRETIQRLAREVRRADRQIIVRTEGDNVPVAVEVSAEGPEE